MPDTSHFRRTGTPAGNLPDRTTQPYRLVKALATGHVTQAEFDQYMDFYLGLNMLNSQSDNLITRRLWNEVWLPLGYILCTDGLLRKITTIARYGKRNPKGKSIILAIVNRLIKEALDHLLAVQNLTGRDPFSPSELPIIEEQTHRAVMKLLTANAMAEKEIKA